MAFSIVHPSNQQLVWRPVLAASTIYTGSLVSTAAIDAPTDGVQIMPVAAGISNTTAQFIPMGVCVGNNNVSGNTLYSSTYKTDYITATAAGSTYNSTTQYQGVEGPWSKGDTRAYVLVSLIDATTILRAPLYNAAYGTAPTEATVTVGSGTDGIGCTSTAVEVATVAVFATIYARTGKNAGIYRTMNSASTTTHTWLHAMPRDMEIGDKILCVGVLPFGSCYMQTHSSGMFINTAATAATDYFIIDVVRLDLSVAGKEYIEFRFNADNFTAIRA
jgi:hypothetical protein